MDFVWRVRLATVGIILVVLFVSGPFGFVDLTPDRGPNELGEGTATVSMASDPASDLRIDRGRFGTGVFYLRISPAVVDVSAVEGRPRLVYVVEVPTLDYEGSESELLTDGRGRTRIHLSDRAFANESITKPEYRAHVLVRLQSFTVDRVIYNRTVTVPVEGSPNIHDR